MSRIAMPSWERVNHQACDSFRAGPVLVAAISTEVPMGDGSYVRWTSAASRQHGVELVLRAPPSHCP